MKCTNHCPTVLDANCDNTKDQSINVSTGKNSRLPVVTIRVRTILALGNLVLGNTCRYWVVLLLGDIFSREVSCIPAMQNCVAYTNVIPVVSSAHHMYERRRYYQ